MPSPYSLEMSPWEPLFLLKRVFGRFFAFRNQIYESILLFIHYNQRRGEDTLYLTINPQFGIDYLNFKSVLLHRKLCGSCKAGRGLRTSGLDSIHCSLFTHERVFYSVIYTSGNLLVQWLRVECCLTFVVKGFLSKVLAMVATSHFKNIN